MIGFIRAADCRSLAGMEPVVEAGHAVILTQIRHFK